MEYVRFLANQRRLPIWQPVGGGEAGYESQHPPLYYAAAAVVYSLSLGLPENWRWYVLRWFTLAISGVLFWVARRFSLEYFKGRFVPAFCATAGFSLTPTTLLHMSYINVDILSVLLCSVVLWMSVRLARGTATRRDRATLGLAFGLGLLTKITVFGTLPVLALAHFLDPQAREGRRREERLARFSFTVCAGAVIAGWWYARNSFLYRQPFIHTTGRFVSGFEFAQFRGFVRVLRLATRETYLSMWAQRGWLDPGPVEIGLYAVLSALLLLAIGVGVRTWLSGRRSSVRDPAPWLCGLLMLSMIIGHQMQVWCSDIEFNAGGRYLLNGFLGLQALIVSGLYRARGSAAWLLLWVGVVLVMDTVAVHRIWTVLNPLYVPGWQLFQSRP